MTELLRVNNLATHFKTEGGLVKALDGVSYYINEQEIIGIVGESGCGKSVSQLSTMQLISAPGEIVMPDRGIVQTGRRHRHGRPAHLYRLPLLHDGLPLQGA